jgi:hypothetical protein
MKALRLITGILAIVALTLAVRPRFARAEVSTAKPCGYYYVDGSSWHDFPRDNDCRQNPHAEAQAGLCNVHDVGVCSA